MSNSDVRMWTLAEVVAEKSSGVALAYIIGPVIVGVALLIGAIGAIVFYYKKRHQRGTVGVNVTM